MKNYHRAAMAAAFLTLAGGCAGLSGSAPVTPVEIAESKVAKGDKTLQKAERNLENARDGVRSAERAVDEADDRLERARREEVQAERQLAEASRDFNAARVGLGETLVDEGVPGSS